MMSSQRPLSACLVVVAATIMTSVVATTGSASGAAGVSTATTTVVAVPVPVPRVEATAVEPDGSLVVAIPQPGGGEFPPASLVRINPDGTLDQTFGNQGSLPLIAVTVGSLLVDPSGRILATGMTAGAASGFNQAIERVLASGQPDSSFDSGGVSVFASASQVPSAGGGSSPSNWVMAPDGTLYVASTAVDSSRELSYFGAVTHVLGTGAVDSAYGKSGSVSTPGYPALVVRPNGDLLVAGNNGPNPYTFTVFDPAGHQVGQPVTYRGPAGNPVALAVDGNAYIVQSNIGLARYAADTGALDAAFSHGCPSRYRSRPEPHRSPTAKPPRSSQPGSLRTAPQR
jgi:uncharacterized delta-60 repeat protein